MRHRHTILTSVITLCLVAACSSDDATAPTPSKNSVVTFRASLSGANEVPANTSTATGTFSAALDTVTNVFVYDITFSGLSANVTAGHIHGPAAPTANAGTTINFATLAGATFSTGQTSGTAHGQTTLLPTTQITATIRGDSLKTLLFAGLTYVNIHTTALPGGEIRGQILKQ